jgi:hypothetical protein
MEQLITSAPGGRGCAKNPAKRILVSSRSVGIKEVGFVGSLRRRLIGKTGEGLFIYFFEKNIGIFLGLLVCFF